MTQKTVAVNLASGIISAELSTLSDEAKDRISRELKSILTGHPFTSGLTLADAGGGNVVQLAGQAIRSLRKNPNEKVDSAVGHKMLADPELAWFLRVRNGPEAVFAPMLMSAAFIAHRWAQHQLINIEAAEHKHLGQLLAVMSEAGRGQVV